MKHFLTTFCLLSFAFFLIQCERSTSPLLPESLHLTAEYVAVTEADLHLEVDNLPENAAFEIRRGDSLIYRGALQATDTTVTDTALLPAHSYTYKATLFKNGKPTAYCPPLQITTLDTTSHDFTWEITEFPSPYGSGLLRDVSVVNEDNIWAVGEIYSDSAQPWLPYNAVHWDGQRWELKKIYVEYRGQPNLAPLEGVFALPDGKIIFSSGLPYIPEGDHWKLYHLWDMGILSQEDGSVYRIWGTSMNNIYFAGRNGTIARYDGQHWHRIESGTNMTIQDIWGAKNKITGEDEVYCVASTIYYGGESRVMKIENNGVVEISNTGLPWSISGIWFEPPSNYYIVGDGIFYTEKANQHSQWIELVDDITGYYTHAIRGIDINDVFLVGAYNTVIHFNGMTWKNYQDNELPSIPSKLLRLDVKNGLVVIVGYLPGNVIIIKGVRKK